MTGPFFVDTNILVYARDESESEKQPQARAWLEFLWKTHQGRVSMQVVQEYYQVMARRLRPGLQRAIAQEDIRDLMIWRPILIDRQVVEQAWVAEDHFQLSWWDALIVGAARQLGCRYLLTEDLQDGRDLNGLTVVDPFNNPVPTQ
jgi:predicted nucleic acid-binding protein